MKVSLVFSLFANSLNHNYNAALQLYSPPAMFTSDIVPALPDRADTEDNRETLERLRHDLRLCSEGVLSASDLYRFFGYDDDERPFWGYCVESACVAETKEIFMLMHITNDRTQARVLRWIPMEKLFTRKHAHLVYKVFDVYGPGDVVMMEILELLEEVFEIAVKDEWSYEKRMEFYHAVPFDGLDTEEAVEAFRSVLSGCPAFFNVERIVPEAEEKM